jgi:hypothetical protein
LEKDGHEMKTKIFALVFAGALALSAFAGTAFAAASPNDNECNSRGVAISDYVEVHGGAFVGAEISGIASTDGGQAIAANVHGHQTCNPNY